MFYLRSHRLEVRTSDSHSENMGSIPVGTAKINKSGFIPDFSLFSNTFTSS